MDLESALKRANHKDVTGRLYGGSRGNSPNASRGHSPANCSQIYLNFIMYLATARKTTNFSRKTTPIQSKTSSRQSSLHNTPSSQTKPYQRINQQRNSPAARNLYGQRNTPTGTTPQRTTPQRTTPQRTTPQRSAYQQRQSPQTRITQPIRQQQQQQQQQQGNIFSVGQRKNSPFGQQKQGYSRPTPPKNQNYNQSRTNPSPGQRTYQNRNSPYSNNNKPQVTGISGKSIPVETKNQQPQKSQEDHLFKKLDDLKTKNKEITSNAGAKGTGEKYDIDDRLNKLQNLLKMSKN